jgi:hypothetical protein
MPRVVALVLVIALSSCTTKGQAVKCIAVGAGMFVTGVVLVETGPKGASFELNGTQTAGLFIGLGGLGLGAVSLIALIALGIRDVVPPSSTPFRPTPDTAPTEQCGVDGSCVPIRPPPPAQQLE